MCSIDYCDEFSDVWHETRPTARKSWKCVECSRMIRPGERYLRVGSLFQGRWDTYRTCQHCDAAGTWLRTVCGGYLTHGLMEELEEHWGEGYRSMGFGRLIVGMRRRWRDGADEVPDREAVSALGASMMRAKVAP